MEIPSFQPLYHQIRALITQSLIDGEWRPGELIPSELDLAARFKVSQGTVRKAVDSLAAENILIRKQGKGTYVATHHHDEIQLRFLRLKSTDGQKEELQSTLLSCHQTDADHKTAQVLQLNKASQVIDIKRLLVFSGRPLIYDHIVVPYDVFNGLNSKKIEAKSGSMYRLYESAFGVRMIRAEEKLKAVSASDTVASTLGVQLGMPMLSIERVAYTYGNKPMEWRLGICLTDNHHYMNELE